MILRQPDAAAAALKRGRTRRPVVGRIRHIGSGLLRVPRPRGDGPPGIC